MNEQILVVEDDEDLHDMLVMALEDVGYAVRGAYSGSDAIELARAAPVDLVITDVRMKDMDGLTTLSRIKVFAPRVRSIIMTGYASDDAPTRAMDLEALDYLYKPFALKVFLEVIQRALAAEEEAEKGLSVVRGMLKGIRNLADKVVEANLARQLKAQEEDRRSAFLKFFVAVRSKKLDANMARLVWEQVERTEKAREALKRGERGDVTEADFKRVVSLVDAYCRSAGLAMAANTSLDRNVFLEFYRRIQAGSIPCHELPQAAYVRTLTPFELQQSVPLQNLYASFWPGLAGRTKNS